MPPPDKDISCQWGAQDIAYNTYGTILWEYNITCNLYGRLINGVKHLKDKSLNRSSYAFFPWSCESAVAELSFSTGPTGHINFAWAAGYSFWKSVSIGWQGTGFVFEGGGTQLGGVEYIPAEALN